VIGLLPATPVVEHAINLIGLTSLPLLYLYARRQARPSAQLRRVFWLWTPVAAYAAAVVIRATVGLGTRVGFVWMLPVLLAFTIGCAAEVIRREDGTDTGLLSAEWLLVFLVVINIAQVTRMFFGHIAPVPALVPFVITVEFVVLVALLARRAVASRAASESIVPAPRYGRSSLGEDAGRALLERVDAALTTGRRFADPALTLSRLAAAVDSTPHQVSEALNRFGNLTFHELLNRRRVDDVKTQLCDASAAGYTIEGIGASAGFGSRSALYAAFRRLEGVTPAEFRATRAATLSTDRPVTIAAPARRSPQSQSASRSASRPEE